MVRIGVTTFPEDGHTKNILIKNADYNKEFQLHYQPQINIQEFSFNRLKIA